MASYASLIKEDLTLEQAEHLLRDTLDQQKAEKISINTIQQTVADYYELPHQDLVGSKRPRSIAFPRQIAMYLCRSLTHESLPSIGEAFDRNHATVLHAYRLIEEKIKRDSSLRQTISTLRKKIGYPNS